MRVTVLVREEGEVGAKASLKSWVASGRLLGFPSELKKAIWVLGLEATAWEVEKGLLVETVYFEVKGDRTAVERLVVWLDGLKGGADRK